MEWGPVPQTWRPIRCCLEKGHWFRTQKQGNHGAPFRAAAAARRNQHYRRTRWDGFVAALRLWAAPELSRGRFASAATAIYSVFRPNLEIPHQSAGGVF